MTLAGTQSIHRLQAGRTQTPVAITLPAGGCPTGANVTLFTSGRLGYNGMDSRSNLSGGRSLRQRVGAMGTSTAQRSPATAEWERVRELYREGVRDPAEIARRITLALTPSVRAEMAGPGVVTCLDELLAGAHGAAQTPPEGPAAAVESILGAAGALRREAERRIALGGLGSRHSDLALDALGSAALEALGADVALSAGSSTSQDVTGRLAAFQTEGRLHELARNFTCHDVDRCFRHLVTRDISEFVGGPGLPTVADARAVADDVARHCAAVTAGLPFGGHEGTFQDAASLRPAGRVAALHGPFGNLLREGLGNIIGG